MKIVLVVPNFDSYLSAPSLGVLYLSSWLKKHNIESVIIEALRDNLSDEEVLERVKQENPDMVGFHCMTGFYKNVVNLSNLIKKNGFRCMIGGAHPTFTPYSTLKDCNADFVICGEGEIPLLKLCQNNFNNEGIRGVYKIEDLQNDDLQKDGTPVQKGEWIDNLDEIPFPDWEQIPPDSYGHAPHGIFAKGFPIGIVMASRGCPYRCSFCSSNNFYDKTRFRSVDNVLEEVEYLIKRFKIKELQYTDDNLTLKKEYITELCTKMIERKIKINWTTPNGIRADRADKDVIMLMKKAGCYMLDFGIESADPEILKTIKKGETIEQIEHTINLAHECGLITIGNFIFGLPGETKETINKTINFAVNSKLDRAGFFGLRLFPGSDLYNKYKSQVNLNYDHTFISFPDIAVGDLTKQDIVNSIQKAYWKFYFRPRRLYNTLNHIPLRQTGYILKCMANYHLFDFGFLKKNKKEN